ncbi:HEXB [Cordylochernes scorpioides]|uniref:beta-N-acetylhexosaminidase n=1 Tax=Cordylochernes scorpioides TaxID=51811 RepID=A0ABY6KBV6_9ARAC|nr:HEXB [Cordylochernes scorpioides]
MCSRQTNPHINDFMEKNGMGNDYAKLESYYIDKVLDLMNNLKRNTIVWQEVFDNSANVSCSQIFVSLLRRGSHDKAQFGL